MDDTQLQALFAIDAPPARDPAFTLAVLQRMERENFRRQILALTAYAGLAVLLSLAFSPLLMRLGGWLGGSSFVVIALVLISLWMVRRDLPGARMLEFL